MAEDLSNRDAGLRKFAAVFPNRIVEIQLAVLRTLEQQDRSERAAQIADEIRRVRRRRDPGGGVLVAVTLFPNDHAVADDGGRKSRNPYLLPKGFEIVIEDRQRAVRRKDGRLLRDHNRRGQYGHQDDRRRKSTHHRMKVNFARPTTSSACQGHTKDMIRGVLWARTRT